MVDILRSLVQIRLAGGIMHSVCLRFEISRLLDIYEKLVELSIGEWFDVSYCSYNLLVLKNILCPR